MFALPALPRESEAQTVRQRQNCGRNGKMPQSQGKKIKERGEKDSDDDQPNRRHLPQARKANSLLLLDLR